MRKPLARILFLLGIACLAVGASFSEPALGAEFQVQPITAEQSKNYTLDQEFYKKGTLVQNILIATSDKVPDVTHREAAYLFDKLMTECDPAVAARVRERQVLCILLGHSEQVSELPQYKSDKTGKELDYYNWRSRGFLELNKNGHPTVLFTEEDVMEYEGGMRDESILIHEFGHVIAGVGFDKEQQAKLSAAFQAAKDQGRYLDGYAAQKFRRVKSETPVLLFDELFKSFPDLDPEFLRACMDGGDILVNGKPCNSKITVTKDDKVLIVFGGAKDCYAVKNRGEYWAEIFQNWFDTNRTMDHDHNHIHTRDQLKEYDPEGAKLVALIMGDKPWTFVSPRQRIGQDHLAGYDPTKAPKVTKLDHIDKAAQDYYDKYWKTYWQRLIDKHQATAK